MQDRSVGIKRVQIKRAYGQLGKMTRQLERVPEGIRLPSVLLWLEDNAPLIREALRAGGEGFAKARRLPRRGERAQRLARGLMRFAPEEERIAESLRQDLEPDITEGELWMVPGLLLGLEALQAVEAAQAAMAMLEALEALRGENRRGLRSAWGQWSDRRRAAFVAAAYGIAGDGESRRLAAALLAERGEEPEPWLERAYKWEAEEEMAISDAVRSIAFMNQCRWWRVVERVSPAEAILREDAVHAASHPDTRRYVRKRVAKLAQDWGLEERAVARAALARARESEEERHRCVAWQVSEEGAPGIAAALERDAPTAEALHRRRGWSLFTAAGVVALLLSAGLYLLLGAMPWPFRLAAALLALLPGWGVGISWAWSACSVPAAHISRMDDEVKPEATLVVVPALVTSPNRARELMASLEVHHLAEREQNFRYLLLGDFRDGGQERDDGDEAIVEATRRALEELEARYGTGRFFFLYRNRVHATRQGKWMGWERKRGALAELNAYLLRGEGRWRAEGGGLESLRETRYVMTLDADTRLVPGSVATLTRAMMHPANRPVVAGGRVVSGYGMMQPNVALMPGDAAKTPFARAWYGNVGLDPYVGAAPEMYMDLFGRSIFTGKGIYDLRVFEAVTAEAIPADRVLSHDLLEGGYARCALVGEATVVDGCPTAYLPYLKRGHRWMRGDWQLVPWLRRRVLDRSEAYRDNPLPSLVRYQMLDNLRRSLAPAALLALAMMGAYAHAGAWALAAALFFLFEPPLAGALRALWQGAIHREPPALRPLPAGLVRAATGFLLLPVEAYYGLDAMVRSLHRTRLRKNTLQWVTAAQVEGNAGRAGWAYLRGLWQGPAVCLGMLGLANLAAPTWTLTALLFLLGPAMIGWMSKPDPCRLPGHADLARSLARQSYAYFEDLVGPNTHYLPPDNWQEEPYRGSANRTSPTNIGLMMLSHGAALDFGWIGPERMLTRLEQTMNTLQELPKWEGHLYNWYDIETGQCLPPAYISTVDSGNFAVCLMAVAQAAEEAMDRPFPGTEWQRGLLDALAEEPEEALRRAPAPEAWEGFLSMAERLPGRAGAQAGALCRELTQLQPVREAISALPPLLRDPPEAYAAAAELAHDACVRLLAPATLRELRDRTPVRELDGLALALGRIRRKDIRHMDAVNWCRNVQESLEETARRAGNWIERARTLAAQCREMALGCRFGALYDGNRDLFYIGYHVDEGRMDGGHYDLLASEARMTSLFAVAKNDVPVRHFRRLGKRVVHADGLALQSWSGTFFEYLMPRILLDEAEGTLLCQSARGALRTQKAYARRQRMPWGVSESGFYAFDDRLNYQYRAFGIPELAMEPGQGMRVCAPYSVMLALPLQPNEAVRNLREMARLGMQGPFGPREAIDFTSGKPMPVKSHMAHHLGMGINAALNLFAPGIWVRRFHAAPLIRAVEPLLWEKPALTGKPPHWDSPAHPHRSAGEDVRSLRWPGEGLREAFAMSNGAFSVAVTAAGTGYAALEGRDVNRFRQDPVRELYGLFIYLQNRDTQENWSATPAPLQVAPREGRLRIEPGVLTFTRRDGAVETRMELGVSPDENVEVRRVRLTNRSHRPLTVSAYAYAELALNPRRDDEAHSAFQNLFVRTRAVEGGYAASRRARKEGERVMSAALCASGGAPATGTTSRYRALGRGRDAQNPLFLEQAVTEETGSVTDPCFLIERRVHLAPGASEMLVFALAAAWDGEEAEIIAQNHASEPESARALERARVSARAQNRYLGLSPQEERLCARWAARLLGGVRSHHPMRERNPGIEGLWAMSLSGDDPIILVPTDIGMERLRQVERVHRALLFRGIPCDLAILAQDDKGYRRPQHAAFAQMAARDRVHLIGGEITADQRRLLEACAWIRYGEEEGEGTKPQVFQPRRREKSRRSAPLPGIPLEDYNGFGGFRENRYVIDLAPGRETPMPWANVLANGKLGCILTERGGGWTWFENSRQQKLTPYMGDMVTDPSGEALYLRDEQTGEYWSVAPGPVRAYEPYRVEHGQGFTRYAYNGYGLEQSLTVFLLEEQPVKVLWLQVANPSDRPRTMSACAFVQWVLGVSAREHGGQVATGRDQHGYLWAENAFSGFPGRAFLACPGMRAEFTCRGAAFIGRGRTLAHPAAMSWQGLDNCAQPDELPAAALRVGFHIPPGGKASFCFALGAAPDGERIPELLRELLPQQLPWALERVLGHWDERLGRMRIHTPDPDMDRMVNRFLPYQVLASRLLGRAGLYQPGGAYGFRDQLQDALALLYTQPELVRERILDAAAHQFREGDVQHWWHPPRKGVRTRIKDDLLFLPFLACRYADVTGQTDIWEVEIPWLEGPPVPEGQEDWYGEPAVSQDKAPLWQHCRQAFRQAMQFGEHGLPLMGGGDWNDGMNRVGIEGRGESVWLGFFLYATLAECLPVMKRYDRQDALHWEQRMASLRQALETHGWDGEWYRRAYFDDGTPLGTAQGEVCRIDAISQSWAVLSGAAADNRARTAMEQAHNRLFDPETGIMRLLDPPFDEGKGQDPGYIRGYIPGVRENGGQYTHAAVWMVMAWCALGEGERAHFLFSHLNPIDHARTEGEALRYRAEPYAVAADIYGQQPLTGRGGWTWYTGSAAWMHYAALYGILGLRVREGRLWLEPAIPKHWPEYTIYWQRGEARLEIRVCNPNGLQGGVDRLLLDGEPCPEGWVPLPERGEHLVEAFIGACQ